MIALRDVAQVRAAEDAAFRSVAPGALMQRAAMALSISCARLLREVRGSVTGARVVLLVGPGNNGGDALWAGAFLAARGCRVDAMLVSSRWHADGASALRAAGGRLHPTDAGSASVDAILAAADLVVDGLLGIGGSGGLRPDAADLVRRAAATEAIVVAVDVPSGVDADTGAVAGAAVRADVTVTFGAVKPGLVVAPGCFHAGTVQYVDIGLEFPDAPTSIVLDAVDVASWVPEPGEYSYKYTRGVVGVSAGSRPYPGAALLVTAAARHADIGMTRFLDRADGTAPTVVEHYPDVVLDGAPPAEQQRATAWACGSGFPGDPIDEVTVLAVLDARVPAVLDAGALAVVAGSAPVRERLHERHERGLVTVLTPHQGEFERLQPGLLTSSSGRLAAALSAAVDLGAVVVLKGPGTVVAAPGGATFVDTEGTAALGTAGSGDVLTGIVGGLLAGAWARGSRDEASLATAAAAAVWLHGRAGRIASQSGPVVATGIVDALPAAVRAARFGADG